MLFTSSNDHQGEAVLPVETMTWTRIRQMSSTILVGKSDISHADGYALCHARLTD